MENSEFQGDSTSVSFGRKIEELSESSAWWCSSEWDDFSDEGFDFIFDSEPFDEQQCIIAEVEVVVSSGGGFVRKNGEEKMLRSTVEKCVSNSYESSEIPMSVRLNEWTSIGGRDSPRRCCSVRTPRF